MSETHLIEQAAMSGAEMEDDAGLSFNDTRAKSQVIDNSQEDAPSNEKD